MLEGRLYLNIALDLKGNRRLHDLVPLRQDSADVAAARLHNSVMEESHHRIAQARHTFADKDVLLVSQKTHLDPNASIASRRSVALCTRQEEIQRVFEKRVEQSLRHGGPFSCIARDSIGMLCLKRLFHKLLKGFRFLAGRRRSGTGRASRRHFSKCLCTTECTECTECTEGSFNDNERIKNNNRAIF